jgi:hypothetical protein
VCRKLFGVQEPQVGPDVAGRTEPDKLPCLHCVCCTLASSCCVATLQALWAELMDTLLTLRCDLLCCVGLLMLAGTGAAAG